VDREIARARHETIESLVDAVAAMRAATDEAAWREAVIEAGRKFAGDPAALQLIGTLAHLSAPVAKPAPPARVDMGAGSAAQRFARVKIAEIQLYHGDAVKAGRASRNLYGNLKLQIDEARAAYREQFLQNGNTADDLHAEIVHALANDDATLLGPEYPGPE